MNDSNTDNILDAGTGPVGPVARRDDPKSRLAVAYAVWADAQNTLQQRAQWHRFAGERPAAEQLRCSSQLVRLQVDEAWARVQLQLAVQLVVDGLDGSRDMRRHFVEWWGESWLKGAEAHYEERARAESEAYAARRAAAEEKKKAHESVGLPY